MATFTSINVEDGSEPEERTIEAREAEIIRVYERALRGRDIGAQADFRWVLAEPLVEAAATEQLQRIKFLSLKNLAELLARGGTPPPAPGAPQAWQQERLEALRLYCAATEMEGSDAVLWNRLATLAAELGCWAVAKHALERGLECDPQHPALPDKLLQLLLHMGDSAAAAQFAAALLRQRPWHGAAAATLHPSQLEVSPPYGAAAVTSSLLLLPPGGAGSPQQEPPVLPQVLGKSAPLQQLSWHSVLQECLRFLGSNKPGSVVAGSTAASGADGAAVGPHKLYGTLKLKQPVQHKQLAASAASTQPQPVWAASPATSPAAAQVSPPAGTSGGAPAAGSRTPSLSPTPSPHRGAGEATGNDAAAGTGIGGASLPAAQEQATPARGGAVVEDAEAEPALAAPDAHRQADAAEGQPPQGAGGQEGAVHRDAPTAVVEQRTTRSRAAGRGKALAAGSANDGGHEQTWQLLLIAGPLLALPTAASGAAASPVRKDDLQPAAALAVAAAGEEQATSMDEQAKQEAAAVSAFLRDLPSRGVPRQLLPALVLRRLADPAQAAALPNATRPLLLQLAQAATRSPAAAGELPPAQCLVLAELHADAAAAAATARSLPAVGRLQQSDRVSGRIDGPPSLRARRTGGSKEQQLGVHNLCEGGIIWLLRFRITLAQQGQLMSPQLQQVAPARPTASEHHAQALAGPTREGTPTVSGESGSTTVSNDSVSDPSHGGEGVVRYWWALGRLQESRGETAVAAVSYNHCLAAFAEHGMEAPIVLPHCRTDGGITPADVAGKLEVLRLHGMLVEAAEQAQRGAAIARNIGPALLSCDAREEHLQLLDRQLWIRGLQLLLQAAAQEQAAEQGGPQGATGRADGTPPAAGSHDWLLGLRCHLRLLAAVLPPVPASVLPLLGGEDDWEKQPQAAAAAAAAALKGVSDALAASPAAAAALEAAVECLSAFGQQAWRCQQQGGQQQASTDAGGGADSDAGPVTLQPLEWQLLRRVQMQLLVAVQACCWAATVCGGADARLNTKVHSWQQLVCDAAICTIHLATAAPLRPTPASMSGERPLAGAPASAARVAELLWALCEVLGPAGALPLERGRTFLRACMAELKLQLDRVNQEQHGAEGGAAGRQVDAEDEPTAEETAAFLQSGIHHCLLWLSGVDLRTRDDQEWCAGFQADARGAGQECLAFANKDAVAEVWPLVAPQMLREAQAASRHMAKFRGFLEAVAVQFPGPPAAVARQSMAAWQRMATREAPPVAGAGGSAVQLPPNPMRTVFADALEAAEAASAEAADASPEPMDVEVPPHTVGPSAAGVRRAAAVAARGELEELHGMEAHRDILSSLFYLQTAALPALQEVLAGHVLGEEGDAQLEAYLAPAKADLCYNPDRSSLGWAYLAARYHEAADMLLEEGCEQLKPGELEQRPPLLQRLARWRRLGHWCCAVGLGIAGLESNRGFLLKLAGHKLLGDLQNAPPRFDQQARRPSKDSPAYKQQLAAATAAFQAAAAALPHDWKLQLLLAKCKRKEGRPPADWLPLLARACRLAEAGQWGKGGLAEPLYALHAARAKLLLGAWYQCRRQLKQQTTVDSQGPSGAGMEGVMCWQQAGQLLPLLARHCFLQHSQAQAAPLVASLESPAAADQSVALRSQLERVLLHDCATAMRWIVERQRSYHKAARRLAQVLHVLEGSGAAAEALAPLFTPARSTKAAFTINMHAVAEEIGPCSIDAADGDVPESDWGLQPARLAGIGVNEQLPSFYARLRRCLCSYLDLLVDSRGVAVLAAADNFFATGAMGWHVACLADMEQKAKGLLVVGLASALQKAVPFEQLTCPEEEAKQPQGGDGKAAAIHCPRAAVAAPGGESPKATPPSSDQRPPRKTPIAVVMMQRAARATAEARQAAAGGTGLLSAGPHPASPPPTAAQPHAAHSGALAAAATPASPTPPAAAQQLPSEPVGTPALGERQRQHLRQLAARLDSTAVGPLLHVAHDLYQEHVLLDSSGHGWGSQVVAPAQRAARTSRSRAARDVQVQLAVSSSAVLFRSYAELYVDLLRHQRAYDKLLSLLKPLRQRYKAQRLTLNRAAKGHMQTVGAAAAEVLELQADAAVAELAGSQPHLAAVVASGVGQQLARAPGITTASGPATDEAARGLEPGCPAPAAAAAAPPPGDGGRPAPTAAGALSMGDPSTLRDLADAASQLQEQQLQPAAAADELPDALGAAAPSAPAQTPPRHPLQPPGGPVPAGGIGTPLPGGVPSIADAKQLEQAAALLRAARSLHKEVQQGPSAKAGKEPATPRATGLRDRVEALLLRAYGLHVALATGSVGRHAGRAEVLRACDEISRQQRRASRPPPAVGGAGAAGAPAAEKMSPVPEERQQGQRGRTRARSGGAVGGAADDGAPEPSGTRKRAREAGGGAAGETPAAPAGFAAPPAHRPPEPAGIAGTAERPPLLSPLSPEDVKEMMALVEQEREEQERGAKRRRSEESGGRGEDVAQQADERADLEHDAGQEPPAQTSTAAAAGVAE